MADKEAVVYIVDLGESMGDCHNGRLVSDLDWSMKFVWDKISTTVAASRKTWNVGVLGLRTDETSNALQGDDGYDNIAVLQELGPMNMTDLQTLYPKIRPSSTSEGDSISAIVVAVDMIAKLTKKLKYKRKIYLITDGEAPVDGDDFDDIASKIKETEIELTILGVDFDDAEVGVKEEDKSHHKAQNEILLRELADKCDGQFGTMEEAISYLDVPRLKATRPYKSYDGPLTLGDPEVHPDAMSISVERYFKTHKATIPPASRVVVKDGNGGDDDAMEGVEPSTEFSAVKNARTYKVNDPKAPGGKRDVELESLAKGYQYGSTAVHISEAEFNITKIETTKSFSIVGFIQQDKFEPFLNMGEAGLTVAQKFNDASALKLSSFIHALHELESYAVARLVAKDGKEPLLVLLAPHIDVDFECLYDLPLPFAEDVRSYRFPPLDKVVTLTGQTLSEHKQLLPSTELQEVMDDFVDSMDISTWERDDEGERTLEYAPIEDVFCPPLHRINQVVRHRAVHADEPLPPVPEILLKYSHPPEDLIEKARSRLEDLIETACVKKVPPKVRGKRDRADRGVKPISGLDVAALLKQDPARKKLDPSNAVPEFKQMIEVSESMSQVEDAAKQMGNVIRDLITDSLGNSGYDQAIEDLGVFRAEMIDMMEPDFYNAFVTDLKKRLLAGELGGDRRELWWQMKGARLGLIDETQSETSKVTPAEAADFYKK